MYNSKLRNWFDSLDWIGKYFTLLGTSVILAGGIYLLFFHVLLDFLVDNWGDFWAVIFCLIASHIFIAFGVEIIYKLFLERQKV